MESPPPPAAVSSQVSVNESDSEVGASSIDEVVVDSHEAGYILEDVRHLTHYLPDLPPTGCSLTVPLVWVMGNIHRLVFRQYSVHADDTVAEKVISHKGNPRGTHFRRAGPRQKVYFNLTKFMHVL